MTRAHFRELIQGTLALWQADARACFDEDVLRCRILRGEQVLAVLGYEQSALGGVWRIAPAGRAARVHLSIVPALAGLREVVCPQRPRGRAIFVPAPEHDGTGLR